MSTKTLEVGVVLPSWTAPRWVARTVEQLAASEFVTVAVVALRAGGAGANGARGLLYRAYSRADRALFKRLVAQEDAFDPVDVRPLVPAGARTGLGPSERLDVLLSFAGRAPELVDRARYGVWSYHHGGAGPRDGAPPYFWEMLEGRSLCDVELLAETESGRRVICASHAKTNTVSLHLNRNASHWKGSDFALRGLRELYRLGWEKVAARAPEAAAHGSSGERATPGSASMLRFFGRLATSAARKGWEKLLDEHYFLAYRERGASFQDNERAFTLVVPPKDRFYADPFMLERDGRHHVFFEDAPFAARRAHISHLVIEADGRVGEPQRVLEAPYHLSYPFVFEWHGAVWMVPESRVHGRVDLFRAVDFPTGWRHEQTLLKVPAVDSTLFEHDGRWWMFTNLAVGAASTSDELHLWSAPQPTGPWKPHPSNPVVSDVRAARPAGSVFRHEGALIRPAQDSERRYGYRVGFHRIEALNEKEYRDRLVHRLEPTWNAKNLGSHTYNAAGRYEIIDGRFHSAKWRRALPGAASRVGAHG